jgi:PAS domain S-box-containing protein
MEPRAGAGSTSGAERAAQSSRPRAARVGRWLCLGGALIGAFGLLDATTGSRVLAGLLPGEAVMAPNSALGLLLIGGAAALRDREDAGPVRRSLSLLAALLVLGIGILTLGQHALGVDLRIDGLIVRSARRGALARRPVPVTAIALSLLAGALALLDFRPSARARPSEWLALGAGFAGLTASLGFVFGVELQHHAARAPLIGSALPTAVALLLISIGFLLERPHAGLMRVASSAGPGGLQFRRFILPAILAPIVLGVIVTFPLRAVGSDALAVVVAVLASAMTFVGLFVLIGTAVSLNRTYEALESSRARTRTMFEHAPDGVFIADLAGRYTDVNDAGCRMLGYSRDEILGKTIADLIRPDEVPRLSHTRSQLLRGDTEKGEWNLRRKDGSYVTTEVSAKIFPDGRWQGLVRDISERKRLEAELRNAEAEQKFLAELGSALVSTIDDRETIDVVAARIVGGLADGCSIETLEEDGQIHDRVVAHRDPGRASLCRRLETLERPLPFPGAAVRASKRAMFVTDVTPAYLDSVAPTVELRQSLREMGPKSFLAVPLLAHGGVVGSLIFFSTTPGRRYTQQDLPFAEAVAMRAALAIEKARLYRIAQHAIRLREDVLSVVAHDLRNPLGTILMQTALLRRRADDQGRRRKRDPAEVIERAATRMNHLIQDLLDVARMEGGRLVIDQARVSAREVLSDAVQAQEPLAAAAAMELRVDAASELPELWADRSRLLQIFENLVGNAIKFTAPGGRITLGAVPGEGHVLFWVADTGAGIAREHVPHLFERLWQASKAGQQGAGLGLPIAKGIVDAHGGQIWVESKVGAGSTFFFTIPDAPVPADVGESAHPPA